MQVRQIFPEEQRSAVRMSLRKKPLWMPVLMDSVGGMHTAGDPEQYRTATQQPEIRSEERKEIVRPEGNAFFTEISAEEKERTGEQAVQAEDDAGEKREDPVEGKLPDRPDDVVSSERQAERGGDTGEIPERQESSVSPGNTAGFCPNTGLGAES